MDMPINERAVIGSNSRPAQMLRDDIETVLSDDHEKLFHFAKWHIEDYIEGTEGMKLETEGAYIRFLMRLYKRGKPLPDDDRFMSIVMGLSIRVWKRVKDSLISIGKIIRKCGYLTNSRFEKERLARAEQLRKQAEGMRLRWQKERAKQKAEKEVSPKFAESLDEVSPKLAANTDEKPNEINETGHSQLDILNIEVEKDREDNPPIGSPPSELEAKVTKREGRGGKTRLPDDWQLDLEWRADTKKVFGATDEQIDIVVRRFHRYWTGPDAKNPMKADWKRAWENWFDKEMARGIRVTNGTGGSPRFQTPENRQKSTDDAWFERELADAKRRGLV
jgi:uncharacterized protein YdaU (DUF1376 family)